MGYPTPCVLRVQPEAKFVVLTLVAIALTILKHFASKISWLERYMLFRGVVTGAVVQLSRPLAVVHDVIQRAADWGIPFLLEKHES